MNFDCIHNQRQNICRRLPGKGEVSHQCEVVDGRCQLKGATIEDKIKISGPIAGYSGSFTIENKLKRILLFADAHFSISAGCGGICSDYDFSSGKFSYKSKECYDITAYLDKVFNDAKSKNQRVDLYLETPYIPKGAALATKMKMIDKSYIEEYGYISKIYGVFYECFIKDNLEGKVCPYNNVRFHYTDIRLLPDEINKPTILELYIATTRIFKSMNQLINTALTGERSSYIENTNVLINKLYATGERRLTGQTDSLATKLFKLYIKSDDFFNDINDLMQKIIPLLSDDMDITEIIDSTISPDLIVKRNGKIQHMIRSELWALEQEGQGDMSRYIEDYFMKQYFKNNYEYQQYIVGNWNIIMQNYNHFLHNRDYDALRKISEFINEWKTMGKSMKDIIVSTAYLMDIYTLARFFRTFELQSDIKIIYAGLAHIKTYVDFFQTINVKFDYNDTISIEQVQKQLTSRCINVPADHFLDFN